MLDNLATLQNSYATKLIQNEETSTVILTCDVKLNIKPKDAIKLENEYKSIMAALLKPYIDQQLKDLQIEVGTK